MKMGIMNPNAAERIGLDRLRAKGADRLLVTPRQQQKEVDWQHGAALCSGHL